MTTIYRKLNKGTKEQEASLSIGAKMILRRMSFNNVFWANFRTYESSIAHELALYGFAILDVNRRERRIKCRLTEAGMKLKLELQSSSNRDKM